MRKVLIILAFVFAVLGIACAILPFGTIGILPTAISLICGLLAFFKSDPQGKNIPKWLMIVAALTLFVIIGKSFIPDEVGKDAAFDQKKIQIQNEDKKDLEDLE